MYRRDLITAEIQKLAQVLARIMGLKLEGKLAESDEMMSSAMENEFGLSAAALNTGTKHEFEQLLLDKDFPAEKLDMLSQFLFFQFDPHTPSAINHILADRLLSIYHVLEVTHHVINMVNLDRQKVISNYLNA